MTNTDIETLKSARHAADRGRKAGAMPDKIDALLDAEYLRIESDLLRAQISNDERRMSASAATRKGDMIASMFRAFGGGKGSLSDVVHYMERTLNQPVLARALSVGGAVSGGFAVPTILANEFIESLRPASVIRGAGATVYEMPNGNLALPRVNSGATASYSPEGTNIVQATISMGMVRGESCKVPIYIVASNDLLRFATPALDRLLRAECLSAIADSEDRGFLVGTGLQNTPLGIANQAKPANLLISTGSTGAQVDADLGYMEFSIRASNVPLSAPAWFMNPRTLTSLQNLRGTGGNKWYPELDFMRLRGKPVFVTNHLPVSANLTQIVLADMANVLIFNPPVIFDMAKSGSYVDGSGNVVSAFSADQSVFRVVSQADVRLRHDEAVSVLSSVSY